MSDHPFARPCGAPVQPSLAQKPTHEDSTYPDMPLPAGSARLPDCLTMCSGSDLARRRRANVNLG